MSNTDATIVGISLDLIEPVPDVVDMGAPFALVVAVPPDAPCDLARATFRMLEGERIVAEGRLGAIEQPTPDPDAHDPRDGPVDLRPRVRVQVTAPPAEGRYHWRLLVPAQEIEGVSLAPAELAFTFSTCQHRTSLAAWNAPSPVQAGAKFSIDVGAKCSAGCDLRGLRVVATSAAGVAMGQTTLTRAPDDNGLYCGEIDMTAPDEPGPHECLLHMRAETLALSHSAATGAIAFVVAPPAAHEVKVMVRGRQSGLPLEEAQVRLGLHRSATDAEGAASFHVAAGPHRVFVWRADHAFAENIIDVQHDQDLTIMGDELPKKNPYARWDG